MAISAPVMSTQYLGYINSRDSGIPKGTTLYELQANLVFTAAGFTTAAAGDLSLLRLPAGTVRIYMALSKIICPAGTATSDLDIGISSYTSPAGATVSAVNNALSDSLDVGGGALSQALGTGNYVVDSRDGADVVCSFDTANSPSSGSLIISIIYQLG
jgi:hypothetical protein